MDDMHHPSPAPTASGPSNTGQTELPYRPASQPQAAGDTRSAASPTLSTASRTEKRSQRYRARLERIRQSRLWRRLLERAQNGIDNSDDPSYLPYVGMRQLVEDWALYRWVIIPAPYVPTNTCSDHCDWNNLAAMFHDDGIIWSPRTGAVTHKDHNEFLMHAHCDHGETRTIHRCHGVHIEFAQNTMRCVTRMRATASQRFMIGNKEVDVEADCEFVFLFEKMERRLGGNWVVRFLMYWSERDKMVPVAPGVGLNIGFDQLGGYQDEHKCLAYCLALNNRFDLLGHQSGSGGRDPAEKPRPRVAGITAAWLAGISAQGIDTEFPEIRARSIRTGWEAMDE
ncbi:uncharacterized protein DSM5745_11596 [Aspergillus mulundensis]|uniref:SnoaL-like domain-containing protein n=1 Tax=Aspergillus mulundensis TaxID=1810919 RepID=A0A3D8Q5S3_9EURO|nr:hypothetical protein DSM5745_11596 [Aspergillus mulundensis]RDW56764.1 hypothetical protein DSM5745_11596 [Aspergillus mulundensis]